MFENHELSEQVPLADSLQNSLSLKGDEQSSVDLTPHNTNNPNGR